MFNTITEVKKANKNLGHYFFSKDTRKFFNSRIESSLLKHQYFITSEQFADTNGNIIDYLFARLYTVRQVLPTGEIKTVGDFQQFKTLQQAKNFINNL